MGDQASRPGALLHLDVKEPRADPGRRGLEDARAERGDRRGRGLGWDYVRVAVDDATRVAYAGCDPDERGETAARFLRSAGASFAEAGVGIARAMTDRAFWSTNPAFAEALETIGARLNPTRPYRPQRTARPSGSSAP